MLRYVGFLLSILLLIPWGLAHSRSETTPRYAVAFQAFVEKDNEPVYRVHVASLDTNDHWRVDILDEDLFFGEFNSMLVLPYWRNSRMLVIPGWAHDASEQSPPYDSLYQYDLNTGEAQPLIEHITAPDGQHALYGFSIEEISPDGGTALLYSSLDATSGYLINLKTGTVIAGGLCPLNALAWLETEVIVTHTLFAIYDSDICQPAIYGIDLTDGTITRELANPDTLSQSQSDIWNNTVRDGFLFDDNLLLTTRGVVSLLPLDGSPPLKSADVVARSFVEVAPSRRFAALYSFVDGLYWLDLETFETTKLADAQGIWERENWINLGDSELGFWSQEDNGTYTLKYVTYDGTNRHETVVYSGQALVFFGGPEFAPGLPYAAWTFEDGNYNRYVEIYDSEGHLRWTSQKQFPRFTVELGQFIHPWPQNARWAHFVVWGGLDSWNMRTLSVDLETGETRLAPEDAILVSVSPDSVWWLYVIEDELCESEQLIAYNWQSGDLATLYDGSCVYQLGPPYGSKAFVWKLIDGVGGN
jgi:hypothetical protein